MRIRKRKRGLRRRRFGWRRLALAGSVLALSALVAGGAVAAGGGGTSSQLAGQGIQSKVNALLAQMTLDEKLEQLQLEADWQINDAEAQKGVGGVFSLTDPEKINHF